MARDMSDREFIAAIRRHGFTRVVLGQWVLHQDFPGMHFGVVFDCFAGRIARRATLARLLRSLARERERQNDSDVVAKTRLRASADTTAAREG